MSGPVPDGGSPVVVCPSCDGLGFAVVACRCTDGGDRLLVTDGMDRPAGEPYRDCLLCQGDGAVGEPCHDCGQTGRRRAQLVLTMANLDTGAVASANVVPGVVEPVPWPGDGGESWYLPLGPLLRDLAAVVGVESWTDARQPGSPDGPLVLLPRAWRPESPEVARRAEEAAALAGESLDAWRVYLGRGRPAPARDPAVELGRWCRLADLLCLDLVVEARQQPAGAGLTWTVRYEVPGTPVPDRAVGHAGGLAGAILATSDADVCCGLAERGLTAPAHRLAAGYQPRTDPPVIDLDRLERRILDDCASTAAVGAQAVWRDATGGTPPCTSRVTANGSSSGRPWRIRGARHMVCCVTATDITIDATGPRLNVDRLVAECASRGALTDSTRAALLGVDRGTVWRWRHGKQVPSLDVITRIAMGGMV